MNKTAGVVGAAALALLTGRAARAEAVAQAVANVTGGATDNPLLAPAGGPGIGLDEFTTVRASLQGQYRGQRSDQALTYTYAGTFYATQTEANSQAHLLMWSLNATPTGRTELRAQVGATYQSLNSLNPLAAAAALNPQAVATTGFLALPDVPVTYVGTTALANGRYRPNGTSEWSEATSVNAFVPTSGETGHSIGLSQTGHYERQRARNALILDLGLSYLNASTLAVVGQAPLQPIPMFQVQGTAGWRRDVSAFLYYAINAGAMLMAATDGSQVTLQPVGQGILHYQSATVLAELALAQSSQMNVVLGQTFMVSGLSARTLVPIDRLQRFRLAGVASANRQWTIDSWTLNAALDMLAADVGIVYQPLQQPYLVSLDYSVQEQIGHMVGATSYPDLHRQAVMLTLTGTWGTDRNGR